MSEDQLQDLTSRLDAENTGKIPIFNLLSFLKEYLYTNGSKKELIEAFRTFDIEKKGKISLSKFRLIMKKYGKITNEELDGLTLDIFQVKKLNQVPTDGDIMYLEFCDRLFTDQ